MILIDSCDYDYLSVKKKTKKRVKIRNLIYSQTMSQFFYGVVL